MLVLAAEVKITDGGDAYRAIELEVMRNHWRGRERCHCAKGTRSRSQSQSRRILFAGAHARET
jgi:hypothetical protein